MNYLPCDSELPPAHRRRAQSHSPKVDYAFGYYLRNWSWLRIGPPFITRNFSTNIIEEWYLKRHPEICEFQLNLEVARKIIEATQQ